MRKAMILIAAVLLLVFTAASAQERGISLTALGEYAYNTSYGSGAALDLVGDFEIGNRFDCEPALQFSTFGVHTAGIQTRSLFPLNWGTFYLKNRIVFKDVARSGMYDASLGLSLGLQCKHFDAEFGMFGRAMDSFGRDIHTLDAALCEPFNLIYSIKGIVMAPESRWNAWATLSNVDMFQMERMWQPIITVGGLYRISNRIEARLEAVCKPTGMFHLNAEFYSLSARAGITFAL